MMSAGRSYVALHSERTSVTQIVVFWPLAIFWPLAFDAEGQK